MQILGLSHEQLIIDVLTDEFRSWTRQGFGFLRTNIGDHSRLHIWHRNLMYDPIPTMPHNHPWNFTSEVITGDVTNVRYSTATNDINWKFYDICSIQCGMQEPKPTIVGGDRYTESQNRFIAGDIYTMHRESFHRTIPSDWTCTIITRDLPDEVDPDEAKVLLSPSESFVSAMPKSVPFDFVRPYADHVVSVIRER